MNDWNIQSRAHQCQACGKSFTDKQAYHTLLLDEKQGYLRLDVCEACWKDQHREGTPDRKGFVSHWQGVYEAPPSAPPEAIKRETAETLLRKLVELNDPAYANTAFILAVMLERKRLLKVREQLQKEGRRVFVYEYPKTGDLFTIPDPCLQLNQLEQVQRDVAELLEHGLPSAVVPVKSEPPPPIEPVVEAGPLDSNPEPATEAPIPPPPPATAGANPG